LQASILLQENMDLYNKINLIRQENIELYKKVANELVKKIIAYNNLSPYDFSINCSQIYEMEGPSEVNQESPNPYNFAVVENTNVPVQLELNTLPQHNDVEPSTAPKLG
jgi:MADS-box transcription factor, plant